MTEEIIIDGVDVAGCEYYSKQQLMYIATQPTQKMKDCCLLSNSVNFCKNRVCYYKQLKRLEQENKELKENQCHFSTCEHIDAEIARYAKLSESFLNYRSVLEEIREIAKDIIENDVYENSDAKAEKILNKINEVLNLS